MPLANGLSLPNPLSNGTTADAVQVMADFNYLLAGLNRALLDAGGGAGMNAQSTQIHNLANGTAPNDAVNLSQLGAYALLAGATFTGSVGFTQPISTTSITASGLITGNAGLAGTTLNLSGLATLASGVRVTGQQVVDAPVTAGFSHIFAGAVGYHLYNQGAVCEWLLYQPAHAADDSFHIGSVVSGVVSDHLVIAPGGGVAIPGLLSLSAGLSASGPLTLTGALVTGTGANAVGFLGIPSVTKTANYTLAIADVGTAINMNGTNLILTIPANASVAIPVDSVILITNLNASNLSIAITTDTLTLSGTTSVGTRTLGPNGEARLRKVSTTAWLIAGTALS